MYKCRGSGNHLMTMVVFRDNLALMVVNGRFFYSNFKSAVRPFL